MPVRVALYVRVSTSQGRQSVKNQIRELAAVGKRMGWATVAVYADEVSGAKGANARPGFKELLRAVARREIDLVAAWSVDRLGRSLQDLVGFLHELHAKKVDLYLHQQGLDTTTPAGKALFQMMGVFAEFERAMIRERIMSGLDRARSEGRTGGRPRVGKDKEGLVRAALRSGASVREAARTANVGLSVVQRLKRTMKMPNPKPGKATARR